MEKFKKSYDLYKNSKFSISEQVIEEALIYHLVDKLGFTYNTEIKSSDDLKINFKNRIEKLNNFTLTDSEFEKWWIEFNTGTIFERFIRIQSDQKVIERKGNTQKTLKFFDLENIENNSFEVINQMTTKDITDGNRRFDVNILINGIPMVHIELKKEDKNVDEAFKQIKRYKDINAIDKFLNFTRIYITSNGISTKYFSNNNELNYQFVFKWTDDKNNEYKDLLDFSDNFLSKNIILDFLNNYFSCDTSKEILKVCRPYQYHAIKKVVYQATTNNIEQNKRSGYIWHATGSGKTMTSFKVCELLTKDSSINNIIFLVDRKDLNYQSFADFKSFTTKEKLIVDACHSTDLLKLMINKENDNKIIISTIQKLNTILSNEEYKKQLTTIKDNRIVFIVDECHRSQLGKMRYNIDKFFNNSINYAFTGTPIFDLNAGKDGKTTENIFGKEIHRYTSFNAINDANVLPIAFTHADSISTEKENDINTKFDDELDEGNNSNVIVDKGRIKSVVKYINDNYNKTTVNKKYNAMLAVSSIPEAIQYYKQLNQTTNLSTSILFSVTDSLDTSMKINEENKKFYESIIKEENSTWGLDSIDKYKRLKMDQFKDPKNRTIDIMVVVSMLLTGFDSPITNTLFLDKSLRYQGLIQAVSRTNRVFDISKNSGQIISFKTSKEAVDDAFKLYTNGGSNTPIGDSLWKVLTYDEFSRSFIIAIDEFLNKFPNSNSISDSIKEENKIEFLDSFKKLQNAFSKIRVFIDFKWVNFKIDQRTYEQYLGIYRKILQNTTNKELIYVYNDYQIIEMGSYSVDANYLKNLEKEILSFEGEIPENIEEFVLYKKIKEENDAKLTDSSQRDLMNEFIKNKDLYYKKTFEEILSLWQIYINAKIQETELKALKRWKSTTKVIENLISSFELKKRWDEDLIVEELPEYITNELEDDDKIDDVKDTIIKLITLKNIKEIAYSRV